MKVYRLVLGLGSGYILTSILSVSLSILLPFENQAEAILFSNLFSFLLWTSLVFIAFLDINLKKLSFIYFLLGLSSFAFNLSFLSKV